MSLDPPPSSPEPVPPSPAAPPPSPAATPPVPGRRRRPFFTRLLTGRHYDDKIVVYRHSNLFYWWPVWLLGFIFAAVTYVGDRHMAVVPAHTTAAEQRNVQVSADDEKLARRDVLILPEGKKLHRDKDRDGNVTITQPTIFIAPHRGIGTVYLFTLLIVIVLTNITMRGLWSVLVVTVVVMLVLILYLADALGTIFHSVGQLGIYVNMGGYFLISTVLFILWALNFFILDRMTYMIFTPGQVRVRLEIGGGEKVYSAANITVQKQRSDFFRHWGLGLGSGDILLFPPNADSPIEMHNVLRVGRVVKEIEQLIKERVVVSEDRAN
jgi:hypothetical protein